MKQIKHLTVDSSQFTVRTGFSTLWIIVAVVIVGVAAVLVFGVLDFYKIKKPVERPATQVEEDQQVRQLNTQSTSDEIEVIEQDISATDLEALDGEIADIEKLLGEL